MDKIQRYGKIIRQLRFIYEFRTTSILKRNYTTETSSDTNVANTEAENKSNTNPEIHGFAQAFQKFSNIVTTSESTVKPTFTSLLRHSKFMDLGDPSGQVVIGEIVLVVNNDLYIDFGWKFHCVCPIPKQNSSNYIRGSKVMLRIKSLELSTRFLGATTDLTLLEADCILLRLISSPLLKN
ncbi:mitochondrial ribosomal protein S28 [Ptiloglossa arizonensis]|uniref:mitochondrial ribosomal protein S28 n=1 Tax=Ptiloglossa arizonensis TaxID=3350558 RepID=UPI003FA11BA8